MEQPTQTGIQNQLNENMSQTIPLNTQTNSNNITQEQSPTPTQAMTFAQAANQITFPKKEHAIIMPSIPNTPIQAYILALTNIIEPEKILFRERISNHRICVFLNSKKTVDELLENHEAITIEQQSIPIRRLISSAQRIIISGGSPIVPHVYIENKLKNLNFDLASSISFLNAGININRLKHVQTFKRQAYVNLRTENTLPTSFLINFDGDEYRFYLDHPQQKCSHCNSFRHQSNNCPTTEINNEETTEPITTEPIMLTQETTPGPSNPIIQEEIETSDMSETDDEDDASDEDDEDENESEIESDNRQIKRKREEKLSSQSTDSADPPNKKLYQQANKTAETPKNKEKKKTPSQKEEKLKIPIEEMLVPVKEIIDNNQKEYPLSYEKFKLYIKETKQKSDDEIIELTQTYSKNKTSEIYNMLKSLHPLLKKRQIKQRFTKIEKIFETSEPPTN